MWCSLVITSPLDSVTYVALGSGVLVGEPHPPTINAMSSLLQVKETIPQPNFLIGSPCLSVVGDTCVH